MRPPTATPEAIKAYQEKVEKNKITPDTLPPCPRCNLEPQYFKVHAYRERRFLIIVEAIVKAVYCALVRFRCINCGKAFVVYPDFAVAHKHDSRQTVESFSRIYLQRTLGLPSYRRPLCLGFLINFRANDVRVQRIVDTRGAVLTEYPMGASDT